MNAQLHPAGQWKVWSGRPVGISNFGSSGCWWRKRLLTIRSSMRHTPRTKMAQGLPGLRHRKEEPSGRRGECRVGSFTFSSSGQLTAVGYLELVHNCTIFEINGRVSLFGNELSSRATAVGHALAATSYSTAYGATCHYSGCDERNRWAPSGGIGPSPTPNHQAPTAHSEHARSRSGA
jgi:hypothetical protein